MKLLDLALSYKDSKIDIEEKVRKVFFGRKKQLEWLNNTDQKSTLSGHHWGVHGIRRSGKTTLVKKFIKDCEQNYQKEGIKCFSLVITGDNTISAKENLERAFILLQRALNDFEPLLLSEIKFEQEQEGALIWDRFFTILQKVIDITSKKYQTRFYFFFDEVLWFGRKSNFLSSLGYFINSNTTEFENVSIFIASSSNGWMREKVFQDRNGLHKRFINLEVKPFSFKEIEEYFLNKKWIAEQVEILKYYFLFGGFLKHFNEVNLDYSQSIENNIPALKDAFSYLKIEAESLFYGIFNERKNYQELVYAIINLKQATAQDLLKLPPFKTGNYVSFQKQLNELETAGILTSYTLSKEKYYYCSIPLLYFVFDFIKQGRDLNEYNLTQWKGKMFEIFALQHIDVLRNKLNLSKNSVALFDFRLLHKDLQDNAERPNAELCQCDLILEERGKNGKRLKSGKVYLFDMKFQPPANLDRMEKMKMEERVKIMEVYYIHKLGLAETQIEGRFIFPKSKQHISLLDMID